MSFSLSSDGMLLSYVAIKLTETLSGLQFARDNSRVLIKDFRIEVMTNLTPSEVISGQESRRR